MAKTNGIEFSCESVHTTSSGRNLIKLEISNPNVDELLSDINEEDLTSYIAQKFDPENIYPETELEKWATANGYVKADNT